MVDSRTGHVGLLAMLLAVIGLVLLTMLKRAAKSGEENTE